MRIGIDVRLWSETGVGRYIRNLVTYLHEIDKKNEYVLFVQKKDAADVEFLLANKRFRIIIADIPWHSVAEQVRFPKLLYEAHLDLMHFPYFSVPIFYNLPFVVTVHDLIIDHYPTGKASTLPEPLYRIKHFGYQRVIRSAVKQARAVIVPLDATKDDVLKTLHTHPDKVHVTLEGFDRNFLAGSEKGLPARLKNKKFFLYVGNAYPHKNLQTLLETFALFDDPSIKLVLVGKEDYFYQQIEQALKRTNNTSVVLLHEVDDSQLRTLYKQAIAVVAPSFIEGFGLVPLETLGLGGLVIASDIPAHKEVCQDSALYFNPHNKDSLLDRMREAFGMNEVKRNEYKKKGLKEVKRFSWGRMAEQTLQIYEQFKK